MRNGRPHPGLHRHGSVLRAGRSRRYPPRGRDGAVPRVSSRTAPPPTALYLAGRPVGVRDTRPYNLGHETATTALAAIREPESITVVSVSTATFETAAVRCGAYDDQQISFVDHTTSVLAADRDIDHVVAFDSDVRTLGSRSCRLTRHCPTEGERQTRGRLTPGAVVVAGLHVARRLLISFAGSRPSFRRDGRRPLRI